MSETTTATGGGAEAQRDGVARSIGRVQQQFELVMDNVRRVIVGKDDVIARLLVAMTARGHVLLRDVPGVGKTMLARSVAASMACVFKRIQFTPDLLPMDVTGSNVFDMRRRVFEFQRGPVFTNLLLADEINRAPPKTQSALLEVMEERQVTVEGETHKLDAALPGHRHHEPARPRGHLRPPRRAARPLHDDALDRLPRRGRGGAHARRPPRSPTRRSRSSSRSSPATTSSAGSARSR